MRQLGTPRYLFETHDVARLCLGLLRVPELHAVLESLELGQQLEYAAVDGRFDNLVAVCADSVRPELR